MRLQAGTSYSFTIFCDLDYTETSLDGQLDTRGEVEILGAVTMWHSNLMFNNVTYMNGQPTGGSIDVIASVTVSGETYTGNGSVSF